MAKKKAKKEWAEQAVLVKKTHPFAKNKEEALEVAERHAKGTPKVTVEVKSGFRVIERPKTCFYQFRNQKRGEHVTVTWGRLKKGARRNSACR